MSKNKLKSKTVRGRMVVLRAIPYKENMVYIRQIDGDMFTYDVIFKNQLYSSYIIVKPRKGQTKLNDSDVQGVASMIWSGACATIDTLLGQTVEGEAKKIAEQVIELGEKQGLKMTEEEKKKKKQEEYDDIMINSGI